MDCSLPGSSVHGILQARILEWIAISLSRRSSWSGDWTSVSYVSCRLWVAQSQTSLKWLSSSSSSCCIGKLVESGYKCKPYLWQVLLYKGFPDSSVGQESACNAGDPSSNPGSERYLLEKDKLPTPVFLDFAVAQLVKNLLITQETWVWSLGWEHPLGMERLPTPVFWPGEYLGSKESDTIEWLSRLSALALWVIPPIPADYFILLLLTLQIRNWILHEDFASKTLKLIVSRNLKLSSSITSVTRQLLLCPKGRQPTGTWKDA